MMGYGFCENDYNKKWCSLQKTNLFCGFVPQKSQHMMLSSITSSQRGGEGAHFLLLSVSSLDMADNGSGCQFGIEGNFPNLFVIFFLGFFHFSWECRFIYGFIHCFLCLIAITYVLQKRCSPWKWLVHNPTYFYTYSLISVWEKFSTWPHSNWAYDIPTCLVRWEYVEGTYQRNFPSVCNSSFHLLEQHPLK
jgi:hypothetical protein